MASTAIDVDKRRRRRRRRVIIFLIYAAIAVGLAWFFESQATTTVIFVRHAEKASEPAGDPPLSPAGQRRVAELTRQLEYADVIQGIDAIYATPFRRTRETAQPLSDALDLPITSYDPELEDILAKHKGKIILVVGHSNTIPGLIADLGASKRVPPIAEQEYDNIYVVSIPWFGKTKTIRLRYGEPYRPALDTASNQDE